MSYLHFGRAVPLIFQRFPKVSATFLTDKTKELIVPTQLEGDLNLVFVNFGKQHLVKESRTWYLLAQDLETKLQLKEIERSPSTSDPKAETDAATNTSPSSGDRIDLGPTTSTPSSDSSALSSPNLVCYTLLIRPRSARLFAWFLRWRYRRILQFYITNRLEFVRVKTKPNKSTTAEAPLRSAGERVDVEGPSDVTQRDEARHKFAENVLHRALISFLPIRSFIEDSRLPDPERAYAILMDREGRMRWCEHEEHKPFKSEQLLEALGVGRIDTAQLLPRGEASSLKLPPRSVTHEVTL